MKIDNPESTSQCCLNGAAQVACGSGPGSLNDDAAPML
jgi:hypothetical protein